MAPTGPAAACGQGRGGTSVEHTLTTQPERACRCSGCVPGCGAGCFLCDLLRAYHTAPPLCTCPGRHGHTRSHQAIPEITALTAALLGPQHSLPFGSELRFAAWPGLVAESQARPGPDHRAFLRFLGWLHSGKPSCPAAGPASLGPESQPCRTRTSLGTGDMGMETGGKG